MELPKEQLVYLKSLDSKKKKRKFLLDCFIENIELFNEFNELLTNQFQFDGKWVKVQKPEIGIKPLWLHNELRLKEINDAIDRYVSNSQEIPSEWMFEKRLLESTIKKTNYSTEEIELVKHNINQREVTEQGSELLKFDMLEGDKKEFYLSKKQIKDSKTKKSKHYKYLFFSSKELTKEQIDEIVEFITENNQSAK